MTAPLPTASRWNTYSRSRYPALWNGCVAAWCPSLGPSGSRLHDYSRRNNWGTLTNMDPATDWVVSGGAYALDFDGSNDNVTTLSTFAPGAGPMTVAYWYDGRNTAQYNLHVTQRPASFNSSIHSCWGIGQGNYNIGPVNTLRIGVLLYTPGNYRVWFSDSNFCDKMRHYAFTTTGSAITVYVDGVEVSGVTTALGNWPDIPATSAIAIGGSQDGTVATNGIIDDVRIYSRALHPEEWRLLARRRAIAYEPAYRPAYYTETDTGGATPWLYARRRSQIIGSGGVH